MTFDTRTPRVAALGAWNSQTIDVVADTPEISLGQVHHLRAEFGVASIRHRRQRDAASGDVAAILITSITLKMSANQRRISWVAR